jgi:DNA polymerase-1
MRKAVFVLGVLDRCARDGHAPLSENTLSLLKALARGNDLDVQVVVAVPEQACAGAERDASMDKIRKHRGKVVEKINAFAPDFVFCFGKVAAASVMDRGNVVLEQVARKAHDVPGVAGRVVVLDGMGRVEAQPGVAQWLHLDMAAALDGHTETVWGDYAVLLPGTPEWEQEPEWLVQDVGEDRLIGFDLETYPGLDPWAEGSRIRMGMLASQPGRAVVVQATQDSEFPEWFTRILADDSLVKCGSNIAFDYRWCDRFGIPVNNLFDTSVAEHLIDETNPKKGLKDLTFKYLPRLADYSHDLHMLIRKRGKTTDWHLLEDHEMYEYAGADAEASVAASIAQMAYIREHGLTQALALANDLYPVLTRMTARGLCFSMEENERLDVVFDHHLTELRRRIQSVLGPINVASPVALGNALVKRVKGIDLSPGKVRKFLSSDDSEDVEDEISTARRVLEREADKHPVLGDILEFRKWHKLYGTYIKGMREKHTTEHAGRAFIHPAYNQNRVETHRLSSSSPNQQNIPRKPGENDPEDLNVKTQFISRFPEGHILEADYSQAELRVAAMLSGDPGLKQALTSGRDVHTETAAMLLKKEYDDITKEERQRCKTLNFLILYGGGANTLSAQLGIEKDDAKKLIKQYFSAFPVLSEYISGVHARVREELVVESPFGFRRHFRVPPEKPRPAWDVDSNNDWKYNRWNQWEGWAVQRQAFNHLIQNTAACLTFCALVEIDAKLAATGLRSVICGTVHDSILLDVYPGEEDTVFALVRDAMENVPTNRYGVDVDIPLVVDLEIGDSWGNKKEVEKNSS